MGNISRGRRQEEQQQRTSPKHKNYSSFIVGGNKNDMIIEDERIFSFKLKDHIPQSSWKKHYQENNFQTLSEIRRRSSILKNKEISLEMKNDGAEFYNVKNVQDNRPIVVQLIKFIRLSLQETREKIIGFFIILLGSEGNASSDTDNRKDHDVSTQVLMHFVNTPSI